MGDVSRDIEWVVPTAEESKKSKAGRKPIDALVLLRMLVLQSLYNLSDDQIETCRIDKTAIVNLRCVPRGTKCQAVEMATCLKMLVSAWRAGTALVCTNGGR